MYTIQNFQTQKQCACGLYKNFLFSLNLEKGVKFIIYSILKCKYNVPQKKVASGFGGMISRFIYISKFSFPELDLQF